MTKSKYFRAGVAATLFSLLIIASVMGAALVTGQARVTKNNSIGAVTPILFTDAGWSWSADDTTFLKRCYVTPHGAALMITWSGTAPSSSVGHQITDGETWRIEGNQNVNALQMLSLSGTISVSITVEN